VENEEVVAGRSIPVRDRPRPRRSLTVTGASTEAGSAADTLRVLDRGAAAPTGGDRGTRPSRQPSPDNDL
jgi:hypothetical protein